MWLLKIDQGEPAEFPVKLEVMPQADGRDAAKLMEHMGNVSIGVPKAWYSGVWQVSSNVQCHATLFTTTSSEYLVLERFY
jgi:hypothetical protein